MADALEKFEIYHTMLIREGSSFQLYWRVTFFPRKYGISKMESSRGSWEADQKDPIKSQASGLNYQEDEDSFQAEIHHYNDYLM